jgi:hypothetical protein
MAKEIKGKSGTTYIIEGGDGYEIREEIIENMAKAFFASAWADWEDEYGEGVGGVEILDVMPSRIDPGAVEAAERLASVMEDRYDASLPELLERIQNAPYRYADRPADAEHFGHYAAMQAMGHGVGLESIGDEKIFPNFPWMEFTYFDLDPETYPTPAEEY